MTELQRRQSTQAVRDLEGQFEELSRGYEPGDFTLPLRDLVVNQLRGGYPREKVLSSLDDFRYVLRKTDREELEDDVADVMGFMTGWCSPHMRIEEQIVEEQVTDQQQNVKQAAQEWTEAVKNSFRTLADRTVTLQESNLKLTHNFFQQFVQQLQSQTQGNQQVTQTLQQQGQRQQQAFETLAQESANAYSDFLNSALSFYQQTLQQATQVAQGNLQQVGQVAQSGIQAAGQAAQSTTQAGQRGAQAAQESANAAGQAAQQSAGAVRGRSL